jgi:hypothetical protein
VPALVEISSIRLIAFSHPVHQFASAPALRRTRRQLRRIPLDCST